MPHDSRHRTGSTARSVLAAAVLAITVPMTVQAAALRVVQDPATGELRGPTAAEAEAFAKAEAQLRAATRSGPAPRTVGPKEIRYADGTVETKLDEDTMMYSVAAERPDGTLAMECLPAPQAKKFVKSTNAKNTSTTTQHVAKAGHDHQ